MDRAITASLKQVVRHQGPVLQLASCLRDGRLPCELPPLMPPLRSELGQVGVLNRSDWLLQAQDGLRCAAACDNPDAARILCYTNRTLDSLVPHARRAIHGEMADQMAVLPGEVLISRTAVMAPASRDGAETGEEPDLVLGSNREVVVEDVTPERCDLAEFGFAGETQMALAGFEAPVIETVTAKKKTIEIFVDNSLPFISDRQKEWDPAPDKTPFIVSKFDTDPDVFEINPPDGIYQQDLNYYLDNLVV